MSRLILPMLLLALSLLLTHAASTTSPSSPSSSSSSFPEPASFLQTGSSSRASASAAAQAAASARASAAQRFHSMADRAGIERVRAPRAGMQDRRLEQEQAVMLQVANRVLNSPQHRRHVERLERAGEDPAAAEAEEEFALLNALMEKQSEIREYAANSNEKTHIGGVSRKFLQEVTDRAVENALSKVRAQAPPPGFSSHLELRGVRKPYNGATPPPPRRSRSRYSLDSTAEARHRDAVAETAALGSRSRAQVVYRLGKDSEAIAKRQMQQKPRPRPQQRQPRKQQRKQVPRKRKQKARKQRRRPGKKRQSVPKRKPVMKQHAPAKPAFKPRAKTQPKPSATAPLPSVHSQSNQPRRSNAATAQRVSRQSGGQDEEGVAASSFLELDTSFESMQAAYADELAQGAQRDEQHASESVLDSEVASMPLEQLLAHFHSSSSSPSFSSDEMAADELAFLELEHSVHAQAHAAMQAEAGAEAEHIPLKELGLLLGLNPFKKNKQVKEETAPAAAAPEPAKVPEPAADPSFTQVNTQTKSKSQAKSQAKSQSRSTHRAREDPGAGLDAMVNAGMEYQPSSLKHPPPPPVPPPPPPPPPPKFTAD